ncbi:MAG: Flp pilus assembly complex ATPase component TadA, partial [Deltaproteobacteria bacterium]|nr:Flp pilus assembly complex ATPase component TadA [Deltaproteobacteria bacterium]
MKLSVEVSEKGNRLQRLEFDRPELTIGRVKGNDIILPKGNVSKRHARIVAKGAALVVVDLKSTNGTYVNGRKLTGPHVLKNGEKIYIGDFDLKVDAPATAARAPSPPSAPRPPAPPRPPEPRPPALAPPPLPGADEEFLAPVEDYGDADPGLAEGVLDIEVNGAPEDARDSLAAVQAALFAALSRGEDVDALAGDARATEQAVRRALDLALPGGVPAGVDRDRVVKRVSAEILGLGPLDRILGDPAVSKVFANDPHRIFVERGGTTAASDEVFSTSESMARVISRLLRVPHRDLAGRPAIDARLADGSRVRALLPPLGARGPVL